MQRDQLRWLVLIICGWLMSNCGLSTGRPVEDARVANPAAIFCEDQGHALEIRTAAEGGQISVCLFPDGTECEAWAFYRGECGPGITTTEDPGQDPPGTAKEEGTESASCELPPRLLIGAWGVVAGGAESVLRSAPGVGDGSLIIGTYPARTFVTVLDGPLCLDGINWWQVYTDGIRGWMAEGEGQEYWLEKLHVEPLSEAVSGWVGTIVKYPPGFHLDDYFEREDGEQYGIAGADPGLQGEIEDHRWTGAQVRIWGQVFGGVTDAGSHHILVERIEATTGVSGIARNLSPFATASVSSALPADVWNSYEAQSAIDGSLSSPWCEGVEGPGIDEWILLTFPAPVVIDSIGIDPGYDRDANDRWRDPDLFSAANRLRSISVIFSDGKQVGLGPRDERGLLMYSLAPPTSQSPFVTTSVKVVIRDVYPGISRDDACLAEIEVWGRPK